MTAEVFRSPAFLRPQETLRVSQLAPTVLKSQTTYPYPLSLLLTAESQEKWQMYENIMIACLKTGDDKSAYVALESLTTRFGIDNERVQALQGMYEEAVAKNDTELQNVLKQYEKMIDAKPANMPIRKRRVALLKSMGKTAEAVKALTELLDVSPTDAEAWSELADLYLAQGMLSQAVYCLEEVLLVTPNAWNVHARIGETTMLMANATEGPGDKLKLLSEAMRRFCRSVELCDDYLRGFYGLKMTTNRLKQILNNTTKVPSASSELPGDLAPPSLVSIEKLNEISTSKLAEIVRKGSAKEAGWDGYDEAELIAARELLNRDTPSIAR